MAFDDYEIVGTIGRDTDGLLLVWREQPIAARGFYALHTVDILRARDPRFQARMLREAAHGGAVQHPALVRVHEVLFEPDRAAVVTDYVDGHSLLEVLDRRTASEELVAPEVTLELIAHLLEAVDHVHELETTEPERCYHGRIAASKILLTVDGGMKLAGFGIASDRSERRSPERLGPPADQFAIGLVFLDLLIGRRVSLDESLQPSMGRWSRTLEDAVRSLPISHPALPVLLRMLAPRAEDRFESCAEAAIELHRLREAHPAGPALAGFAASEVAAVRGDDCNETELELDPDTDTDRTDPPNEWLEDLPGGVEDEEFVLTVAEGPLVTSATAPFAQGFMPRAAWFYVAEKTPLVIAAPPPPMPRAATLDAAMDTAGYGSNPFMEASRAPVYLAAPPIPTRPPSPDTEGTLPFANTYAGTSATFTRSVPAWVLSSVTAPIPVQRPSAGSAEVSLEPDPSPGVPSLDIPMSIPGQRVMQRRKRKRSGRSGSMKRRRSSPGSKLGVWSVPDPSRRPGSELSASGFARTWQLDGWLDRSGVLKGFMLSLAALVLIAAVHLLKEQWVDRPAVEQAALEAGSTVHPELAPAPDPVLGD